MSNINIFRIDNEKETSLDTALKNIIAMHQVPKNQMILFTVTNYMFIIQMKKRMFHGIGLLKS